MSKDHKNYQTFYKRMIQLNIEKACFNQKNFQNTLFLFVLLSRFIKLIESSLIQKLQLAFFV